MLTWTKVMKMMKVNIVKSLCELRDFGRNLVLSKLVRSKMKIQLFLLWLKKECSILDKVCNGGIKRYWLNLPPPPSPTATPTADCDRDTINSVSCNRENSANIFPSIFYSVIQNILAYGCGTKYHLIARVYDSPTNPTTGRESQI